MFVFCVHHLAEGNGRFPSKTSLGSGALEDLSLSHVQRVYARVAFDQYFSDAHPVEAPRPFQELHLLRV